VEKDRGKEGEGGTEQFDKHLQAFVSPSTPPILLTAGAVSRKTGSMAVAAFAHCCVTDTIASTAAPNRVSTMTITAASPHAQM
jgi:hypothetical protein